MTYPGKHRDPAWDTGQDDSFGYVTDKSLAQATKLSAFDEVMHELLVANETLTSTVAVLGNRLQPLLHLSPGKANDENTSVPNEDSDVVNRLRGVCLLTRDSSDMIKKLMDHLDI